MRKILWIVLLSLFLSSNAFCEEIVGTGLWLLHVCNSGRNSNNLLNAGLCIGTIIGVTEANAVYKIFEDEVGKYAKPKDRISYCIPKNATPQQEIRIILKYLNDNPERLNTLAIFLITQALEQAWPCTE